MERLRVEQDHIDYFKRQAEIESEGLLQLKQQKSQEEQEQTDMRQDLSLKLGRQKHLSELYEQKYLTVHNELETLKAQFKKSEKDRTFENQTQQSEISQLKEQCQNLQNTLTEEQSDWTKKKRELIRENDFQRVELDKCQIELSDVRDRLKHREDELRELKCNLNGQITQVDSEYRHEITDLQSQNENLSQMLARAKLDH